MSTLRLPSVVGHRGAATHAPENTLASLREARRRGATWVEFDVKLSADGVAMLMHDDSLKRTTGLDRAAMETSWDDIARLDAGAWKDARFRGEPVPSFVDAILCLREEGLGANIEIKPCAGRETETADAAAAILRARWPASLPAPLISSFKDAALVAMRGAAPEYPRAILIDRIGPDWRSRAEAVEAIGVNTNGKHLDAATAGAIKDAGYLLGVYTINDPVQAVSLRAMGVDCVITDSPDVILEAIGR